MVIKGYQGHLEQVFDNYFDMSMLQTYDGNFFNAEVKESEVVIKYGVSSKILNDTKLLNSVQGI